MFQEIKAQYASSDFGIRIGAIPGKSQASYQIIDTDFTSDWYQVQNTECLFTRLIIYEYSKRQLNVALNLKKYYELSMLNFPRTTYKAAILQLSKENNTIENYYPHLNFKSYIPCLVRHFKRLEFVGILKR